MEYNLTKIYESILNGNAPTNKYNSLSNLYEQIASSSQPNNTSFPPNSSTPTSSAPTSSVSGGWDVNNYKHSEFNQQILKTLGATSIPPHENYSFQTTSDLVLTSSDRKIFNLLYPATDGSKATGNGEIAAYWLFGGYQQINSNQGGVNGLGEKGADAPDLQIGPNPEEGLIEIKSYKNLNDISLGKFKDDKENRYLLSILLGAYVLTSTIKGSFGKKERPVTVDVFSSSEIIKAFETFKTTYSILQTLKTNSNVQNLFEHGSLLQQLYDTTSHLITKLDASPTSTPEILANALLRKFAENKLSKKPGFKPGCGLINITKDSKHTIEILVTGNKILDPNANYIDSVSSSSGELKISNLHNLLN